MRNAIDVRKREIISQNRTLANGMGVLLAVITVGVEEGKRIEVNKEESFAM